jgi:GH43 family beta-xylosidase
VTTATVGRAALVAALLALTACSHTSAKHAAPLRTVINPVVLQRADPSVYQAADGYYYLTDSVPDYNAVELRRATTLEGLSTAQPVTLFHSPSSGPKSRWIWAPDIRYYDGTWFIYYSASPSPNTFDHRLYTMQTASADPMTGAWTQNGELATGWQSATIDPTSFTAGDGRRYLVWAQKDSDTQGNSNIYIGLLGTPTSLLGTQVQLSAPELPWEEIGYSVNEAPAVMQSHGKVWITYSASATDASYEMGLLSAPASADLLDPASWTKSPTPVFTSSVASSVYGPGSNSFTVSDDGLDVINVYNARSYAPVADPVQDRNRAIRMQKVSWRPDGTPDFGTPAPDGPTTE